VQGWYTNNSDFVSHSLSLSLWCYSPNLGLGLPAWNSPFHFGFLDLRHSVGLLGRVISSSQGLYLYTNTEKRTHTNTKHPCSGLDSNPRSRLPSERRQCSQVSQVIFSFPIFWLKFCMNSRISSRSWCTFCSTISVWLSNRHFRTDLC
jgi:hypothetical protein